MSPPIGVYGGRELVALLRERCRAYPFVEGDERERCRIVIVDADSHHVLDAPPRKSLVRVVLYDDVLTGDRREGDIRVPRASFLAHPDDTLAIASDLVRTVIHASSLETEVAYLAQIHELMTIADANTVSERITRTVLDFLGLTRAVLFLHDPRVERYVISYSSDPAVRETGEFLPGIPPGLLQRALSSGQSFAADRDEGMIVMPMQAQHDLIGVIRVALGPHDPLDDEAVANVTRYLRSVASVMSNIYQLTRSRDLAMRDDLKTVNNAHGHLAGSRTLQEVAKRIMAAVRGIDKVVRFGGDEFCIILPQTDQEQAVAVAHRVRKAMTASPFHLGDGIDISISASFGIATFPTHGTQKDDLIRQADAAMYRVKATTKNSVGVAIVGEGQASSRA